MPYSSRQNESNATYHFPPLFKIHHCHPHPRCIRISPIPGPSLLSIYPQPRARPTSNGRYRTQLPQARMTTIEEEDRGSIHAIPPVFNLSSSLHSQRRRWRRASYHLQLDGKLSHQRVGCRWLTAFAVFILSRYESYSGELEYRTTKWYCSSWLNAR
jgi:hypothetical protein